MSTSVNKKIDVFACFKCIIPHFKLEGDLKLSLSKLKDLCKRLFFFKSNRERNLRILVFATDSLLLDDLVKMRVKSFGEFLELSFAIHFFAEFNRLNSSLVVKVKHFGILSQTI